MAFSVLVLTLNEEANLPACLESVCGLDDVVVVDSGSTDRTREIAEAAGARVLVNPFESFAQQQNWALDNAEFRHRWVFYLDADERLTPQLRDEMSLVARDEAETRVAFYAGRRNFFRGRWLRFAMPAGNILRFFRTRGVRFEQRGHGPVPTINGEHGYLNHRFDHHNFSKGVVEWLERHARYARQEAGETIRAIGDRPLRLQNFFAADRQTRRAELKNLALRLPGRPLVKFCYLYVLRLGVLDGRAGFTYCVLQAIYEYMTVQHLKEIRRTARDKPL